MKERPILFNGDMVRAILGGSKTQTRRIVKPQPSDAGDNGGKLMRIAPTTLPAGIGFDAQYYLDNPRFIGKCPYGQVGDRLWVREAWQYHPDYCEAANIAVYRADPECKYDVKKWHPSIHMPRWASRITLEITSVRVERLNDISEADAKAEGVHGVDWGHGMDYGGIACYRDPFCNLWESINGPGSWDANPLVWVIEFKRVEK